MIKKFFFKKEEKSIKELLEIFKKNKKPVDCKYIHDHNCLIYGLVHGFKGAMQFKKVYLVLFMIKILRNFRNLKKFNTLKKFSSSYYRFMVSPLLYVFTFNFLGKYFFCLIKKNRILINPLAQMIYCYTAATSIFFETPKRSKDLTAYLFGPTFTTIVHHIISKFSKEKKRMNRKFNNLLYCITFGLLVQCLARENHLLDKSLLIYFRRLFPSLNN